MLEILKAIKNKQIKWEDGKEVSLENIDLRSAHLMEANLNHANLSGADLREANLREADLCRACLRKANLYQANLHRACLAEADLQEADLRWASLWETDLQETNLRGADLRYVTFDHTRLADAKLDGARIDDNHTIKGDYGYMTLGPLGRRNGHTVFFNCHEGIYVNCGCFIGPIDLFQKEVKEVHGTNNHAQDYFDAMKYVESIFKRK